MPTYKIISGGQTGADRAALGAALQVGLSRGGWVPKCRRLAEDGRIPETYPLKGIPCWTKQTCPRELRCSGESGGGRKSGRAGGILSRHHSVGSNQYQVPLPNEDHIRTFVLYHRYHYWCGLGQFGMVSPLGMCGFRVWPN